MLRTVITIESWLVSIQVLGHQSVLLCVELSSSKSQFNTSRMSGVTGVTISYIGTIYVTDSTTKTIILLSYIRQGTSKLIVCQVHYSRHIWLHWFDLQPHQEFCPEDEGIRTGQEQPIVGRCLVAARPVARFVFTRVYFAHFICCTLFTILGL